MNILVVCHYGLYQKLDLSFVHQQAKAYAALGHNVKVLAPIAFGKRDWNGSRWNTTSFVDDNVEITSLRYLSLSSYGEKAFNTKSAIFSLKHNLPKFFSTFFPDVIHAHTLGFDSEVGKWLKQTLRCPLVVTTHGGDTFVPFANSKLEQLKQYASGIDTVVCVSSLLKKRLLTCGVTVPLQVILNGFNVQYADASKEKDPYSIVQVGNLIARKKVDTTIRSLARLKEKYPEASLKVIGSGTELAQLQNLCTELNIGGSVNFLGFLPNAQTLAEMATSTFFVMPSINEGFGIVYLEAMASECITIGTEGEGIADLIRHGENGFLVPPDDPDAIAQVIRQCISDPEKAKTIAQRGQQDALGLTWQKNADQYLALFKTLL